MTANDLIVISGPSGAGKTSLLKKLFEKKTIRDHYLQTISVTTRSKRQKEMNNKDYFFMSNDRFKELLKKNYFLESQRVLDHYYGTPRYFLDKARKLKKNVILCIDVKGGVYLKKNFKSGRVITVFIKAPTERDLYSRLKGRADDRIIIEKKIRLAKKELPFAKHYDYVVTNQDFDASITILESILIAEKYRR